MLATSCRPTGHKPRSTLRLVKLARAADLEAAELEQSPTLATDATRSRRALLSHEGEALYFLE